MSRRVSLWIAMPMVAAMALFGVGSVFAADPPPDQLSEGAVRVCHATGDPAIPYVAIDVAVINVTVDDHVSHFGPIFDPMADPAMTQWGDIIPPISTLVPPYAGLNRPDGQAIWEAGCFVPTPEQPLPIEEPSDEDVPVTIADPGALPCDLLPEGSCPLPQSVPAGGGAAR